jgi:protease-4
MSLDADTIVDRRRMRRKLTFWRVLAVVLAIGAVVAAGAALRMPGSTLLTGQGGATIARISITGLIRSDQERVEALQRLEKSRHRPLSCTSTAPAARRRGQASCTIR